MPPRAIETRYKGYRFRSRLEARWAVFFDHIGLQWEFEPEGFELPGGIHYLPDFKVTTSDGTVAWYEVKPRHKTFDEKFEAFKLSLGDSDAEFAFLLSGYPNDLLDKGWSACPRCGLFCHHDVYDFSGGMAIDCWPCDCNTPGGGGNPTEQGLLAAEVTPHKGSILVSYTGFLVALRATKKAADAATEARFEHGESGATHGR